MTPFQDWYGPGLDGRVDTNVTPAVAMAASMSDMPRGRCRHLGARQFHPRFGPVVPRNVYGTCLRHALP